MTKTTERLVRLLNLIPYLQSHQGVEVEEVVDEFGISEKQLTDDVNLVFLCGLPGYTPAELVNVQIESGRIYISNADTIARPLRLSVDEALALIVALRTLASTPGLTDGNDAVARALAKVEAAAGAVAPGSTLAVHVEAQAAAVAAVREALAGKRRLRLTYHGANRDQTTERDVDPVRLLVIEGHTYLEAWCRLAEGLRTFRLDRVLAATVLDAPAEPPADLQLPDLSSRVFHPGPDDLVVTLDLMPAGRWVAEYYPVDSTEEVDGRLRVQLRTSDETWVRRLALRLGGAARIVDPPAVAAKAADDAKAALAGYAE